LRFLIWSQKNNVPYTTFTGADFGNLMADIRQSHQPHVAILKSAWAAVVYLHGNPASIHGGPLVFSYLDMLSKQAPLVQIHRLTIDLSSVLYTQSTSLIRVSTLNCYNRNWLFCCPWQLS
jgi:hypothetical protein